MENIYKIVEFITDNKLHPLKIELLEGHNFGEKKWHSLGRLNYRVPDMEVEEIKKIVNQFHQIRDIKVEVNRN